MNIDTTGGGYAFNMKFTNARSGFGQGSGWGFFGANTSNITVSNFSSERNNFDGVDILGGSNITLMGGQIMGDSATPTGYFGIKVHGGTDISISNNVVGTTYPTVGASNQNYGIVIDNTFTGRLSVKDNNVRDNATAGIFNSSTSTGIVITGNTGYNPVGVSYPTLGASPWTYTAGASPEIDRLTSGTCTSIKVQGVAIDNPAPMNMTVQLAPGQVLTGTCSVNPNFSAFIQ